MSNSNENLSLPVYVKFTAKSGPPTENLIVTVAGIVNNTMLTEDVALESITPSHINREENHVIYSINITPDAMEPFVKDTKDFLNTIFTKLFDYYPTYTEPI